MNSTTRSTPMILFLPSFIHFTTIRPDRGAYGTDEQIAIFLIVLDVIDVLLTVYCVFAAFLFLLVG